MKIDYREEIDTLRAIAVISVIIFHYFPSLLPRGYLGVDLFFVISGFLISQQIYQKIQRKNFSLKEFYLRRIKRIFPATLFLLIICSIICLFLFTKSDLISYSKSLLASITFTSNIYFWLTGGYFSSNDELKPLLHLWSLSVEEQFYIFFPIIFLFLINFFKKKNLILIIIAISLISYVLNLLIIKYVGSITAFFLLPTRIWNFGIGIIAMIYFEKYQKSHNNNLILVLLFLIILGFFYEIKGLPNGTLIIFTTAYLLSKKFPKNADNLFIFKNLIITKIGIWSFSLYLWHWPFLVFLKYYYIEEIPIDIKLFSIPIFILIAVFSFYFVEKKFRYEISNQKVVYYLSIAIIVLSFGGILNSFGKINLNKLNLSDKISLAKGTNYKCNSSNIRIYGSSKSCYLNNIHSKVYEVALIGNSHAQMYAPSIIDFLKNTKKKGILIPMTGCLPTIDLNITPNCLKIAKQNFNKYYNDPKIKKIIIGTTWNSKLLYDGTNYVKDENSLLFTNSLLSLISSLEEKGKKVYLIGPIQTPSYDLPSKLSRYLKFEYMKHDNIDKELVISKDIYDKNFLNVKEMVSKKIGKNFIDPSKLQCDKNYCYLGNKYGLFFSDSNHLSKYGTKYFSDVFKPIFYE